MHTHASARSLLSVSQRTLTGWTCNVIRHLAAPTFSHCPAPSRLISQSRVHSVKSPQLGGCFKRRYQSAVTVAPTSCQALPRQSRGARLLHQNVAASKHHHSDRCTTSKARPRLPAIAATALNVAPSSQSQPTQSPAAPNPAVSSLEHHQPSEDPSSLSDWVVEWQTSEMARWLASRGENWLLVEGPMLPRDHPTLGRGLFTSRPVRRGESLVEVSKGLVATPRTLPGELQSALPGEVTDWGRMAVFLVLERRKGGGSEWAPYVQAMPPLEKMDSTVFWDDAELALLDGTNLADVTHERRRMMASEFDALRAVMQSRPELFGSHPLSESEFEHGYALVCSRAWMIEDLDHLSMIPFVDFFNHDGSSISHLSYDKDAGLAYIDADRDYEPGEQVLISYGDASNATLALDFGFTLSDNLHDQVAIWMPLPSADPLKLRKAELLRSHDFDLQPTAAGDPDGGAWFTIKESKSGAAGRGEGIPRRLQAFQRVVSATSAELDNMETLARRPSKRFASRGALTAAREAEALLALLVRLEDMYDTCKQQETRLAELLQNGRTTKDGLPGEEISAAGSPQVSQDVGFEGEDVVANDTGFDSDIDAGALGLQRVGLEERHAGGSASSAARGLVCKEDEELSGSTEMSEHNLSDDCVEVGGEKLRRRRVQMAYDVLRGEARVLRSAVAWLRPRSAGGGFEQLMYSERGLASVGR